MTDTIAITGLCKSFQVDNRDLVVLQDLDLTVPAQEITVGEGSLLPGKGNLFPCFGTV